MNRIALQLAMPKVGIAWMFALLTINFNRVAIFDLGVAAIVVTLILALYPLFAPVQPLFGRWIDRRPIMGRRRGPYLLLGMLAAGLCFPPLPWVARELSRGAPAAVLAGIALMVIFGLAIALIANTFLDLVAEVSDERSRSGIFAVSWTAQTAAIMLWAFVFQQMMPTYTAASMELLYGVTPLLTVLLTLPALFGVERRIAGPPAVRSDATLSSPIEALRMLLANGAARAFFGFVFLAILGIFMQDAVLEVYGAAALGMTLGETSTLQQVWNGAVLAAMLITAPIAGRLAQQQPAAPGTIAPVKRRIATAGAIGTALSLGLLAFVAVSGARTLLYPTLVLMGASTGVFTAVTVTLMSDMTIAEATGRYLGLWSMAQAFATGAAFVAGGALYSALVESGVMRVGEGFGVIFGVEGIVMALSIVLLRLVRAEQFRAGARHELAAHS
jgi:BCD family chlorophyll transporter-like MFS transporter